MLLPGDTEVQGRQGWLTNCTVISASQGLSKEGEGSPCLVSGALWQVHIILSLIVGRTLCHVTRRMLRLSEVKVTQSQGKQAQLCALQSLCH